MLNAVKVWESGLRTKKQLTSVLKVKNVCKRKLNAEKDLESMQKWVQNLENVRRCSKSWEIIQKRAENL